MADSTAIEIMKAYGPAPLPGMPSFAQCLNSWLTSKQFSRAAVVRLASTNAAFGTIFQRGLMGDDRATDQETLFVVNHAGRKLHAASGGVQLEPYSGTFAQNQRIDSAVSESGRNSILTGTRFGSGAANRFLPYNPQATETERQVPIAIIGYGAAGILLQRALRTMGFANITVFEKSGGSLGIWAREHVYTRSRNNPLTLHFGDVKLESAPGDGLHVKKFLEGLTGAGLAQQNVARVIPGNKFDHRIVFGAKEEEKTFPIVINCTGVGTPKTANDPHRMETNVPTTQLGERWQRLLTDAQAKRQHFTFIGLGNSTAEMINQIHKMQDRGIDVDYRIVTHYPEDAIQNPQATVGDDDTARRFRVFRDTSVPNLVSWQGDLGESRYDYFRALRTKKIVSGVYEWRRRGDSIVCLSSNQDQTFKTNNLFTLIGYAQNEEALSSFGITTEAIDSDDSECAPCLDYDGEVQRAGLRTTGRLYRGYFAFGAIGHSKANPNSIVLPGMLFRLHDITASIALRAAEYATEVLGK